MQLNRNTIIVAALCAAGLLSGAYLLGKKQGESSTTHTATSSGTARPGSAAPRQVDVGDLPLGFTDAPHEGSFGLTNSPSKFAHFRIGNKNVKSMFAEGKVIWVGTSGGLIRYDLATDKYSLYDNRNGLLSNGIFYVGRLRGQIAVGTYGGGLSLLDEKTNTWKHYNIPDGLGDAFVYEALELKNGDIWIATWSGANRIRGGNLDDRSKWDLFTVVNTNEGLPNDWVYGLAEGINGEVWLATEGGMARFVDEKWDSWNHATGIGTPYEKIKNSIDFKNDPGKASVHHAKQKQEMGLEDVNVAFNPNYIVSLEVAKDGKVWAGTWGGGLTVWDGKQWNNYSTLDGLASNHVFMLHQDMKGQMWVGTGRGLALWKDGKFENINSADGLYGNDVFSMATTADGGRWVGSYGGIAFLKPQ